MERRKKKKKKMRKKNDQRHCLYDTMGNLIMPQIVLKRIEDHHYDEINFGINSS